LEVPAEKETKKQRIIPDGCIEMAFILGDDIKRYTSGADFILQPRAMVLGQTIAPFYIEPTGYVNSFAIRFYPYGFANFVSVPVKNLANTETPLSSLFGKTVSEELEQKIVQATNTVERIAIIEKFLLSRLTGEATIDRIVKTTVDMLFSEGGSLAIKTIFKGDLSKRRQLERKFLKHIGISPKQLGKVIRLQAALKMVIRQQSGSLTKIAYESDYYDQAHFIKDFKEFTGTNPKDFLKDAEMALSSLFYAKE